MLPNLGTRFFVILIVLLIPTLILLFGGPFNLGLDIKGGTSLIYHVPGDPSDDSMTEIKEVMSQRIDRLGMKEITITVDKNRDDIAIELPAMAADEAATVKRTLLELGKLIWAIEATEDELQAELGAGFKLEEFHRQQREYVQQQLAAKGDDLDKESYTGDPIALYRNPQNPSRPVTPGDKPAFMFFPHNVWKSKNGKVNGPGYGAIVRYGDDEIFRGDQIKEVFPRTQGFEQVVVFELQPEVKDSFFQFTKKYIKRNLCIVFNEKLVTRPVINAALPGSGIIEGIGEREEIRKLIVTIKSGSLKIKPKLYMEQQIGPTLGEDAIHRGTLAIAIGSLLVLAFMIWIYRVGGLLANLALFLNLVILLGVMNMMGATLSLPGIAGIILTIGIAVDANILIFERVREERDKGKTFVQSLKNGYDRATVTILDANITTLITGLVLYMFGTGAVKGFAFVLIAGLLVNLFTAIYMTKTIMAWLVDRKRITDLNVVRLFKPPQWDFLKAGTPAIALSVVAIAIGMFIFFGVQGDKIKGLDFSGGALMRLNLKEPMDIAEFRNRIQEVAKVGDDIDIVTVLGNAARTLPNGNGSTIFEIKKSFAEDDEAQAEKFFINVRNGLQDLLVSRPVIAYQPPEGHKYPYLGRNGDDPGRVPMLPQGAQPQDDEERLIQQAPGGFRFTVNFYVPTAQSVLERNLRKVGAQSVSVTPIGDANKDGWHLSYEVWCQHGNKFAPGQKKLADLTVDLAASLKNETPRAVHLADPVPVQQFIGPRVAQDLVKKAILAIIVSIVALIVYIRIRFNDIAYGLGASAALVHDVLITMGAIALFDEIGLVNVKITLPIIAAFLTIIGYSLNDTIVIFDRLRENLGRVDMPLKDAMNLSISQSLTRTFFTSVTTFFVVLCLFLFNYGERGVLEGLGFALAVGVVSGTYSTIFIACPTVLLLKRKDQGAASTTGKGKKKTKAAQA